MALNEKKWHAGIRRRNISEKAIVIIIRTFPLLLQRSVSHRLSLRRANTPVSPEEKWQRLFSDTKWRRVMNVPSEERGPKVWGDFFFFFF